MANNWTPFASGVSRGSPTAVAPNQRLALDNIIRRELKVGDPSDPAQIAGALLERYRGDPRAQAISQEARGLPFLMPAQTVAVAMQPTSSSAEQQQAIDDVNRDLQELTTNTLLKDVIPELQGWAQSIRSAMDEGLNAARQALDQRQRDKAFAIRRQLGDYARLARFVGALTPAMNMNYRSLAQSLDEVSAVLLVAMGEALANVGFAGGRFLLQAPYSELQSRRDAAIYALRNLVGATQEAYGPNDWPRGLDAYRNLYRELEAQGQGDLRSLLVENELARIMDELIQRAAHGTADGLRALGSTAQLDLLRFRRIVAIGMHIVSPESPPLTSFLEALQLFADAFDSAGGYRLLRISRPPILFYGLYGIGGLDASDLSLQSLLLLRNQLADQLDCYLTCNCGPTRVVRQIALDKILYDVDRAIDLYAVGKNGYGLPEWRAAAYSFLIEEFLDEHSKPVSNEENGCEMSSSLKEILEGIGEALRPQLEEARLKEMERREADLADSIADALKASRLCTLKVDGQDKDLCNLLEEAATKLRTPTGAKPLDLMGAAYGHIQVGLAILESKDINCPTYTPEGTPYVYLDAMRQELCLQLRAETNWHQLVQTMAPSCVPSDTVFDGLERLIESAIGRISGISCDAEFRPRIPPHYETSLDSLVDDIDRRGIGRRD